MRASNEIAGALQPSVKAAQATGHPVSADGARPEADPQDAGGSRLERWLWKEWRLILTRPDLSFEEVRKRKLFAVLIVPGICVLLSFAVHHLVRGDLGEGLFDLLAGLWLLLGLVGFRLMSRGLLIYRFNTAVLGLLFVFLAVKGGVHGNKLMWAFSFPLIAFYTLGRAEGLVWTVALFLVLVGLLYVPLGFLSVHPYAPEFKTRFAVAFFLVSSLTYIYEYVRERSQTDLEDERNKLGAETSKLAKLSLELQEANQALKLGEERLKRAQVIARVGNLEYAVASGKVWGSEEALRILGIEPRRSVFPLSLLRQLVPGFDALHKQFEARIRENRELDLELTIHRLSDGRATVLQAKAELVCDPDGEAEKVIGVIQDITERKQAEQERTQLEERLARSQKMEALGILAGGVAHDLNNVLSGIVGYPDLLLTDLPAGSPLIKPLATIKDSGQKAAAIVQDLLALARRGVAHQRILDLNGVVAEYMASPEHAKLQSFHPKVAFETHLERRLLKVQGSAVHLKKAIMNLVSNAAEALPAGGRVRIRTENRYVDRAMKGYSDLPQGESVVFRIEDDGIGISREDLGRIFEPFYTKKVMGRSGTGLGMAVVWGTAQDHRGHVHVESAEGRGTLVELYLPVTREPFDEREGAISLDEYLGKGEAILVVDDAAEQRELARRMLTKLNYVVHTAPSGEAAVAFLGGQRADLVILDMIMDPGADGLETYSRILQTNPRQRAIIVSGFSETERVREAQRLGANAYVKKPYTLETLGMAVRGALDGRPARREEA